MRADSGTMPDRSWRIGISGSYGGTNLGDEAILQSMVASLRSVLTAEITVFSGNPEDTLRRHDVQHAVERLSLNRDESRAVVEGLDLLILGGGGLLYDGGAEPYLREIALAQEAGVSTMTYAISAGPLEDPASRELVKEKLSACDALTVRDRYAQALLEKIGVEGEIHLTADPALLLEPEPVADDTLRTNGLERDRRLIGFSVREPGPAAPEIDPDHYHALLADAADYAVDRLDADVVFLPLERQNQDLQHSHAVVAKMNCAERASVLKGEFTPGQLLSLMGRLDFAIGMRLHFLIFASLAGVPFVALPYATKVSGFLDELELETPVLKEVGAGQLIAHIDRSWDQRDVIRDAIRRRLPELQERARENARHALRVLRSRDHAEPAPT